MGTGFDIVGDIHGQAEKLEALLRHLGYRHRMGAWRHPERKMRFVGDLIDRGPAQLETLEIVRDMVHAGSGEAVLGNHEYNAIAYGTPDPDRPKRFLRIRGSRNFAQHAAFLAAVGQDSPLHKYWLDWFMTLPLWIEDENMRLVHACWHEDSMKALEGHLGPGNTLTPELVVASARKGTPQYLALETICKGMEVALPPNVVFKDKMGIERKRARTRWWDENARTFRSSAMVGSQNLHLLPEDPLPEEAQMKYDGKKPVFFGHYWLTGQPRILSAHSCCVDYSAARDSEPLVAYRFNGEPELSNDNLVSVLPQAIVQGSPKKPSP